MKYSFSFFAVFYLFTQTCYGTKDTDHADLIFMNNLVDPNEYELETLTNLIAFPFINVTNCSLATDFGLIVNYTLIFSDDFVILRGSDRHRYTMEYFQSLVKNHTTNRNLTGKENSLVDLHGVLEIISKPSIILTAVNNIPKGKILLNKILKTMIAKVSPVIVFQIDKDGSITDPMMGSTKNKDDIISAEIEFRSQGEGDAGESDDVDWSPSKESLKAKIIRIPENFVKNNATLIEEFRSIMDTTMDILFLMAFEEMTLEINSNQNSSALAPSSKISYNFFHTGHTRRVELIYEAVRPDFNDLYRSIKPYFRLRRQTRFLHDYRITDSISVAFSSQPDPIIITEKSPNCTIMNLRTRIKSQVKYDFDKSSLKGARKAMQIIPAFPLSAHYIFTTIDEVHGILPEFVQNIIMMDYKFLIYGYGNSSKEHQSRHASITY